MPDQATNSVRSSASVSANAIALLKRTVATGEGAGRYVGKLIVKILLKSKYCLLHHILQHWKAMLP